MEIITATQPLSEAVAVAIPSPAVESAPGETVAIALPSPQTPESAAPEATATPESTPTPPPPPPTAQATDTPAPAIGSSFRAINTPGPRPTLLPTETPRPAPTRPPVDITAYVRSSLPPVFMGATLLLLAVVVVAGFSVIRGPRDI